MHYHFLSQPVWLKRQRQSCCYAFNDLDSARTHPKYVTDLFNTLRFLQIEWDEGPKDYAAYLSAWSQAHRIQLYKAALEQLSAAGLVYACTCPRSQWLQGARHTCTCRQKHLPLDTPGTCWRLITTMPIPLAVRSLAGEVVTTHLPTAMQSFVVRKKDGHPSYQLSSLVDDEYFGVDAIVRGEDLWGCTLAQQYLAKVLHKDFFAEIAFYHHPLVMDAGGQKKLSKSAGATSIRQLRSEGKKKEDIIKMIAHLGLTR